MVTRKNILMMFLAAVFSGCGSSEKENASLGKTQSIINEVSGEFAPDKRVALFQVEAEDRKQELIVRGESNLPEAVEKLRARLEEEQIVYTDSIRILPEGNMKETSNALVKISVANLRSNPQHSAELATQATMGTPLKVYKEEDSWFLVQTPDKYLAWVDKGGIQLLSDSEINAWLEAPKVIFTKAFGESYGEAREDSEVVSDLVAGNVFELLGEENGFYKVKYPGGQTAFIEMGSAQKYEDWVASRDPSGENLVQTSKSLMGLPYLWGGTSPKGVDCSGYTKTVFFLNGIVIPRDASQQVHTGKLVDSTRNFENLIAGDLLFFGRPATDSTSEKVVHVGMWIGDNKFIHSMGNVHVSTVDTTSAEFDEYNYNRYLRTKRLINEDPAGLIYLDQKDIYSKK